MMVSDRNILHRGHIKAVGSPARKNVCVYVCMLAKRKVNNSRLQSYGAFRAQQVKERCAVKR